MTLAPPSNLSTRKMIGCQYGITNDTEGLIGHRKSKHKVSFKSKIQKN